jgi:hypothetical protein
VDAESEHWGCHGLRWILTLRLRGRANELEVGHRLRPDRESEKGAKLAQKLGQLQPFAAVFAQECMGQLAYFGPTLHLSR